MSPSTGHSRQHGAARSGALGGPRGSGQPSGLGVARPAGVPTAAAAGLDSVPAEKLRGIFRFLEDVWSTTGLELLNGAVLRSLAYRLGYLDGILVVGVEQRNGATSHHAVGSGLGRRIASEFSLLWGTVQPSRRTGRSAAADPVRELELLDETLRENEVGDRLVHSLPAPPGVCVLLALIAREGRRFDQIDRNVLASIAPHLNRIFRLHVTTNLDSTLVALLSPREHDVTRAIAKGYSNAEVADSLNMSVHSVKQHATSAMRVTGCRNRTQLALLWHRSTGTLLPNADIAGQRNLCTRAPDVN
jgi:DNA-binding CsgD family transcriptional regulator